VYSSGCEYTYKTHCPKQYPYYNGTWVGGAEHGAPLLLYDRSLNTLVLSPLKNYLVAQHTISPRLRSEGGGLPFAAGINGLVQHLPPGFTHDSILIAGVGVEATMQSWGDKLLAYSGKQRGNYDARSADYTLANLGYWTDRGAYYYGRPDKRHRGWTVEDSLLGVQADMKANGIPVQYFQLDDWFFPQTNGDFGGMHEWRACTYPEDEGMCLNTSAFKKQKQALNFLEGNPPLSLYMGLISNSTVYGKAAGGGYDLTTDGVFSITTKERSPSFYHDLFSNATRGNNISMVLFEQDFLSYWFAPGKGPKIASSDAFIGEEFLRQQAEAASSVGAHVQYCMNIPSTVMASSLFPAVTQAREAKDHVRDPLVYSWKAGLSGLLLWAVGLGSSIDNIFTALDEPGCNGGFNCTEPNRRYEVTLAALSGGPFAIGDGLGFANKDMVMQSCMVNGTLLRPDKQLTVSDGALRLSFDPVSEIDIWSAHSIVGPYPSYRVVYVLSTFLDQPVTLTLDDLRLDNSTMWVAFDRWSSLDGESNNYTHGRALQPAGGIHPPGGTGPTGLTLRACPRHKNPRDKNWISTIIVPAASIDAPLFIGELDKVVGVSSIRFEKVACVGHGINTCRVQGVGVPGEVLHLGLGAFDRTLSTPANAHASATGPGVVEKIVVVGADSRFCAVLALIGEPAPCIGP
jgi:hypothetical protein